MMVALAAFAASDTSKFLHTAGIELPLQDPVLALNLKAAQFVMANRPEDEFERKYG